MKVRIVGITYPDVILGAYLSADPAEKRTAQLSVTAFQALINPALRTAMSRAKRTIRARLIKALLRKMKHRAHLSKGHVLTACSRKLALVVQTPAAMRDLADGIQH